MDYLVCLILFFKQQDQILAQQYIPTIKYRNLIIDLGNGVKTSAQLTLPVEGKGPFPAVLLIHDSGALDKNETNDPWYEFSKRMIDIPKVVFTKTLNNSRWINTDIATGNLIEEVNKIKSQNGGDIVVYGGASFDSSLIKEKLIDEFYFFINPVAIGNGMTIFKDLNEIQKYALIESKAFGNGAVLLHYEA